MLFILALRSSICSLFSVCPELLTSGTVESLNSSYLFLYSDSNSCLATAYAVNFTIGLADIPGSN